MIVGMTNAASIEREVDHMIEGETKVMKKTLVILNQYEAVPATFVCQGCHFEDREGWCPGASCKGIIWKLKESSEEVLEDE